MHLQLSRYEIIRVENYIAYSEVEVTFSIEFLNMPLEMFL
jgi:hypothetical protein